MLIKKSSSINKNENLVGYLFILPILIYFIVFLIFPIVFSLILAFCQWDFMQGIKLSSLQFVGTQNFAEIIRDEWFTGSMKNTLVFAIFTVPIGIAIGLVLAVLINKYVYFQNFFKISLFLPYISSAVAAAVVWSVVLHPSFGPVNEFLKSIGVENPPKWFADLKWALPSVIVFSIWQSMGYTVLVYMAGLKGVPAELYEAAEIDGAGEIKKFFVITLPMVSPTTFFLFIMAMIGSFKVFDVVSALTEGGPGTSTTVVAFYIYREAFKYYEMGKASAAAWVMFIIIFAITLFQWRQQKRFVSYSN